YANGVDITGWDTTTASFGSNSSAATILGFGGTNYLGVGGYSGNIPNIGLGTTDSTKIGVNSGSSTMNFEGIFATRTKTRFSNITDGTSNTLMYGEVMGGKQVDANNPHASYTWMGCGFLPAFPGLVNADGTVRRHWA